MSNQLVSFLRFAAGRFNIGWSLIGLITIPFAVTPNVSDACQELDTSQQQARQDTEDRLPILDSPADFDSGLESGIQVESATEWHETSISGLTIEQAIELAISNDPAYRQIDWQIEKAKGNQLQATRLPNPSAGFSADEIGNSGSGGQYGIFYSQAIVRNNRPALQEQYFSLEIARLQMQFDRRRWAIVRSVAERFLQISRLQQEKQVTEDQLDTLNQFFELTEQLFNAGEISKIAVSNIELETIQLKQKLVELDLQSRFQLQALRVPLGMPGNQSDVANATGLAQVQFDWESTMNELTERVTNAIDASWLARHPQINLAQAEADANRWQIELARSQQTPDINVGGNLTYDTQSDSVFTGFQIEVPIMKHDRKCGAIAAATAEYQRLLEEIRSREMQLSSAYALAAGELSQMQSRVSNIRNVIIPKATENLKQISEAYAAGEAEFLVLQSGIDRIRMARTSLIAAEYDMAIAEIRLQTLTIDD